MQNQDTHDSLHPVPPSSDAQAAMQAAAGASRQAFREMLAAAARVNQHHQGHERHRGG